MVYRFCLRAPWCTAFTYSKSLKPPELLLFEPEAWLLGLAGAPQSEALVFSLARSPILGPAPGTGVFLALPEAPHRFANGSAPPDAAGLAAGAAGLFRADMPDGVDTADVDEGLLAC